MPRAKSAAVKSPDAYRSIGEAAGEIGLQTHVLRYWEGKFPKHIKPVKRNDGRRMFRPVDMEALRAVQILVHERGMTLKGARQLMEEQGVEAVLSGSATISGAGETESPARELQQTLANAFGGAQHLASAPTNTKERLEVVLSEMTDLKARLDAARARSAA